MPWRLRHPTSRDWRRRSHPPVKRTRIRVRADRRERHQREAGSRAQSSLRGLPSNTRLQEVYQTRERWRQTSVERLVSDRETWWQSSLKSLIKGQLHQIEPRLARRLLWSCPWTERILSLRTIKFHQLLLECIRCVKLKSIVIDWWPSQSHSLSGPARAPSSSKKTYWFLWRGCGRRISRQREILKHSTIISLIDWRMIYLSKRGKTKSYTKTNSNSSPIPPTCTKKEQTITRLQRMSSPQ